MFIRLFVLFTIIPLLELALLIKVGQHIGLFNTIAIVLLTGMLGALLARKQGFQVINRIRTELASGQLPGDSLIDAALVLAGALLLVTPGLLTDAAGFCVLIPFTRQRLKNYLKKFFRQKMHQGEINVQYRVEE